MDAAQKKLAELLEREREVNTQNADLKAKIKEGAEDIAKLEKDNNEIEADVKKLAEMIEQAKDEGYYKNPDYVDYAILCHAKTHVDSLKACYEELSEACDGEERQHWQDSIARVNQIWEVDTDSKGNTPKDVYEHISQELDQVEKKMAKDGATMPVRLGHPKRDDVIGKL